MNAERLPKSLRRYAARIADYLDERGSSDLIFIGYVNGFKSASDPLGCVHGDTAISIKEALGRVRDVMPCDCAECQPKEASERKEQCK